MNYYQDSNNGYLMNNQYDDRYNNEYYYDDYSKGNSKSGCNNDFKHCNCQNLKSHCCVKKVEETYLCFPSYYNEEKEDKKEEKKEEKHYPCYQGTFKLYPPCCFNRKDDKKDDCDKKDDKKENTRGCCRNRCCFCCNLGNCFHRW